MKLLMILAGLNAVLWPGLLIYRIAENDPWYNIVLYSVAAGIWIAVFIGLVRQHRRDKTI